MFKNSDIVNMGAWCSPARIREEHELAVLQECGAVDREIARSFDHWYDQIVADGPNTGEMTWS